jgi:hypothetical protein
MITLTLQCCPQDLDAAFELAQLIVKTEKAKRPHTEFFLIYRKDCPDWVPKEFVKLANRSFSTSGAYPARNHDTGWPAGSNMLAASAFIEMEVLRRQDICRNEAFLLFEPDCVPLALDWLDQLSAEWERAKAQGKQAVGHWHQQGDETTLHMNGNAIFRVDFFERNPTTIVGCGTQGWDYWFRDRLIPISCDTYAIFQHYNRPEITLEELRSITKHGRRPALFHGIKNRSGRQFAEELIFRPREEKTLAGALVE